MQPLSPSSRNDDRELLARQIEEYLAAGNKIEELPPEVVPVKFTTKEFIEQLPGTRSKFWKINKGDFAVII